MRDWYICLSESGYRIFIISGIDGIDSENDNVDVEVQFDNGKNYVATFFTIRNIKHLFEKFKTTGECSGGLYLWASDMIIVEKITEDIIRKTVKVIIEDKMLEEAFSQVDSSASTY